MINIYEYIFHTTNTLRKPLNIEGRGAVANGLMTVKWSGMLFKSIKCGKRVWMIKTAN